VHIISSPNLPFFLKKDIFKIIFYFKKKMVRNEEKKANPYPPEAP